MSTDPQKKRDKPVKLTEDDRSQVDSRYQVLGLLGRGGMASVYRVLDKSTGQTLALKQLFVEADRKNNSQIIELFEREFHTLVQPSHPRVVETYDYGVNEGRPYYTMELLDGGDLSELAPLPWQEVCTIAYEICSVLSLLHSRRLVHRDVTPRNIRRTSDGKAKLIDFGLIIPVGTTGQSAGTSPFMAPESVLKTALDGRSDLFSLGTTLYYALTREHVFPARRPAVLPTLWQTSPVAPSKRVNGIPRAVDNLVLQLLRIDAGSRPKSAAEVMERLLPLMDAPPDDELRVASAFLSAPQLVGRDESLIHFRKRMIRTIRRRGGGFLISGEMGTGRSRLIDVFMLEAKLAGATAIRADAANATDGPFGVVAALTAQLYEAAPTVALDVVQKHQSIRDILFTDRTRNHEGMYSLRLEQKPAQLLDITDANLDRTQIQTALRLFFLEVMSRRPIAIAVDDLDKIDEPSLSFLASLTWEAPKCQLAYAVTVESGAQITAPAALALFEKHAAPIELSPLSDQQVFELFKSVFGDVPNLTMLSNRLHMLCGGLPRECMDLAQHLVDQGAITYAGGSWTLPSAIAPELLPSSMEEALEKKVAALSPQARGVARILALGILEKMSRAELILVKGVSHRQLDGALDELLTARMIVGSTSGYILCHSNLRSLISLTISEDDKVQIHLELSQIYEYTKKTPAAVIYHELLGPEPQKGLDRLWVLNRDFESTSAFLEDAGRRMGGPQTALVLALALQIAEQLDRPRRELLVIWRLIAGASARGADVAYYHRVAPMWLEETKRHSGFNDWQNLDGDLDPQERIMLALSTVSERYNSTNEADRVMDPTAAIQQMVTYVVLSIAVGSRSADLQLDATLPLLLEPFVPLNPVIDAMYHNATASSMYSQGKRQRALALYEYILKNIDRDGVSKSLPFMDKVRAAIIYAITQSEATMGLLNRLNERLQLLDQIEQDSNQVVSTHYIRKIAALQIGDWGAAERHRQQAELVALQSKASSMFSTLQSELDAHAMARDLTGLKQVRTSIHKMAQQHPGWVATKHLADANYYKLCGDMESALESVEAACEAGVYGVLRDPVVTQAIQIKVEILTALNRSDEAVKIGQEELDHCRREEMHYVARHLACAVALAQAKMGAFTEAITQVEEVIEEQLTLGVSGLQLGLSYEQAARISIWSGDEEGFKKYEKLMREQYRPGESTVLGALYEHLMEEARHGGTEIKEAYLPFGSQSRDFGKSSTCWTRVTTAMAGCESPSDRAQRALALLCDGDPPGRGHLFLLTDRGFMLSASNMSCKNIEELAVFAQNYFDMEIDGNDATVTVADVDAAIQPNASKGIWIGADGTSYHAVLLDMNIENQNYVAGVAMLTGIENEERYASVIALASALTKNLIDTGDVRAVLAV